MDQLALWVGLRVGATGAEGQALIRAAWAARQLIDGPAPDQKGWLAAASFAAARTNSRFGKREEVRVDHLGMRRE